MVEKDRPGKIFVGGVSADVDEKLLENLFGKYGKIIETLIIRDKKSHLPRGYAFVTFENPLDAEDAIKGIDGMELKGREIHCEQAILPQNIEMSRRGPPPPRGPRGRSSLLLRTAREKLSKARRGGLHTKPMRGRPLSTSFRGGPPGRLRPTGRGGGPPSHFSPPPIGSRAPPSPPPHISSRSLFRDSSRGPPMSSRGPRDLSPPSVPRRGLPRSLDSPPPPRRSSFDSQPYNSSPPYWKKSGRGDRLSIGVPVRGPLRSRDFAPSPPRELRRDYRDDREFREYSPQEFDRPTFREKISSRDYLSSDRDIGSSRSSREYISPRYDDLDREYSSREFLSRDHTPSSRGSRSYSTSRDTGRSFSSHDYKRGGLSPREYDSYRSYGPREFPGPNRGPPSRSYSSYGPSSTSTHRTYISSSSRGGGSSGPSSLAPPSAASSRGPPMSSRGPAPPISSRGPPMSSRGPAPPISSRGPPMTSRGPISSRGPPMSRRGSIGNEPRSGEYSREMYTTGSRRPATHDARGPPAKRPRGPDGPSRTGPPPFRR